MTFGWSFDRSVLNISVNGPGLGAPERAHVQRTARHGLGALWVLVQATPNRAPARLALMKVVLVWHQEEGSTQDFTTAVVTGTEVLVRRNHW